MSETTGRLELEFWPEKIGDADVPANNNAQYLDAVLNSSVVSATTTAEPTLSTGDAGKVYILPASPTGTNWAGKATGTIAYWDGVIWTFYTPKRCAWAEAADTGAIYRYTTAWVLSLCFATVSPASIGANQNNYNATGVATAAHVRLTSSGAFDVTGLAGGVANRRLLVTNIGANTLTLKHESGSSTAANRFIGPGAADFLLTAGLTKELIYDGTSSRWRVVGA